MTRYVVGALAWALLALGVPLWALLTLRRHPQSPTNTNERETP
jgi:hypothetical protein